MNLFIFKIQLTKPRKIFEQLTSPKINDVLTFQLIATLLLVWCYTQLTLRPPLMISWLL